MDGTLAAFGATGLYYVGFAVFKVAADRMAPIRGHRIHHMAWVILSSWIFLAGLVLVLGGLALQIIALGELALSVAVPIFMSGMIPLLVIALTVFGERLAPREWASLLLVAAAMLLIALSIGRNEPIDAADVAPWKLALVIVAPLLLSLALMVVGDHRPDGRHARPVAGIAYGLSAGFPIGAAELAIKGWGDSVADGLDVVRTPYPYLAVLAAALGFGIIIVGFQRCRISIVTAVMTTSAKSYLLVMGTILYGEPWPNDVGRAILRVVALLLAALAVLLFPRYDDEQALGVLSADPAADLPDPPALPNPPGFPNVTGAPGPARPHGRSVPGVAGVPGAANAGDASRGPNAPNAPRTPSRPDRSGTPGGPGTPRMPGTADAARAPMPMAAPVPPTPAPPATPAPPITSTPPTAPVPPPTSAPAPTPTSSSTPASTPPRRPAPRSGKAYRPKYGRQASPETDGDGDGRS